MLAGCRMLNQHQKWWREPSPLQSHSPRAPTNPQQPTQACARQTGRKQAKGAAPCSTAVWEVQKWPGMCHLNWLLHPPAHGILQGEFLVWILPLVWWSCKAAQTKGTAKGHLHLQNHTDTNTDTPLSALVRVSDALHMQSNPVSSCSKDRVTCYHVEADPHQRAVFQLHSQVRWHRFATGEVVWSEAGLRTEVLPRSTDTFVAKRP